MRIFLMVVLSVIPIVSKAWGQKGHDVIANIASRHLTSVTAEIVDSIFEGKSMVYWANWLDNASHTPAYDYTRTWHYKNIDFGYDYSDAPLNPKGDVVTALNEEVRLLLSRDFSASEGKTALKIVIHLMGDLHQPMHAGRLSDLGGNRHTVSFFDTETNLHSVWDSRVLESGHKWSYTEWTDQIDRATVNEISEMIEGSISGWFRQTWEIASDVYSQTPENSIVAYDYIAGWTPTIELQFLRGGLRLAHVLNYVFDADYRYCHNTPLD